ncbi:6-phosphogluconolactonase [Candidatus Bipolaricaulota bacterium]
MKTIVFSKQDDLYRHAAELFTQLAERSIQKGGRFLVLLSGGSTPIPLYERLTQDPWRARIDWGNVFVGWSDERCVPPQHEASNFRMAEEALLSHVPIPDGHVLRIEGELDPSVEAVAYESRIRSLLGREVGVDLALLGLGTDGHTASLFPGHQALQEEDRWFAPVHIPSIAHPWRITATLPLLNASKKVVFLATGRDKAHAFSRIRHGALLPAGLVRPQDGDTTWLVDASATKNSKQND